MRRAAVALLLAASAQACAGSGAYSIRPASGAVRADRAAVQVTDAECVRWLAARRTWNALSLGFGTGAGGGGALTAAVDAGDGGRIAIGVSTLVLGALGVLSAAQSRSYADDFDRYCATR